MFKSYQWGAQFFVNIPGVCDLDLSVFNLGNIFGLYITPCNLALSVDYSYKRTRCETCG